MVREELVNSAVSFLQDPSVASSSIETRIAFLESKNLTQEEINVSLQRAAQFAANGNAPPQQAPYSQQPPAGYGPYPGYWQPPPPDVPKRDWRDWFIMATVMGGVSFGLYVTAKRYILPLIKPPTPPQLTQDKESIDASFSKAFTALEQLETDTRTLKEAEEARTARLDTALTELEAVVSSLKDSDRKREDDARRNADELRNLRDLIPKALEANKTSQEARVRDLASELKSLRTLMSNRVPPPQSTPMNGVGHRPTPSTGNLSASQQPMATSTNGISVTDSSDSGTIKAPTPSASPFPRFGTGKAAIPAWQMAAAKKSEENEIPKEESAATSSSTGTETTAA